jgi:uncharacterized protein
MDFQCTTGVRKRSTTPVKPFFLFAPGAGAPSSHPWMQRWRGYLSELGEVEAFDYDYMREGHRRVDPLPVLIAAHRAVLDQLRSRASGPIFLIGKSMGGRIGCHVALEKKIDGLICLGYPLCGGGDRTKLRDAVLRKLQTPVFFAQGTRDPLCPLDLLETVRSQMTAPNFLHIVEGGDHSLVVRKKDCVNEDQAAIDGQIVDAIRRFIDRLLSK